MLKPFGKRKRKYSDSHAVNTPLTPAPPAAGCAWGIAATTGIAALAGGFGLVISKHGGGYAYRSSFK